MTSGSRNYRRVQERHYSAHHALLRVASAELDRATKKEPGWFDSTFVVLTFSALAVEALSNAIGNRVVSDWKDFESASPNAKVRLLAERLDIPYSANDEPWRTVRWLGKFRNLVAHAKPELVLHDQFITEHEANERSTEQLSQNLSGKSLLPTPKGHSRLSGTLSFFIASKFLQKIGLASTQMVGHQVQGHIMRHNPTLDLAPFGRWTLRDEAAQRRSAPRWASE